MPAPTDKHVPGSVVGHTGLADRAVIRDIPCSGRESLVARPLGDPDLAGEPAASRLVAAAPARCVQQPVGDRRPVEWELAQPGGTPKRLVGVGELRTCAWSPNVGREAGIRRSYAWFLENRT